jgi:anthranilate synthase component 1
VYDHFKETAILHYYKLTNETLAERLVRIPRRKGKLSLQFNVGKMRPSMSAHQYRAAVQRAQARMKVGDIFEVVLSRQFKAPFHGSSLGVFAQYRAVNPSPYMFYLRFPERVLLGASPEMFVKVEAGTVMTRPISGTAQRSADPLGDYQFMLNLLNSAKEKSELDMLIDLARNDLARVCLPGIQLQDYRYVEKYSKVMHTIAHVSGHLDTKRFTAFDALIACLNAGTLTGAPKIRAMEIIEELEPVRRGFYGGCVGYLTFNNELNTGITIRSALIAGGNITMQAGATILLDSEATAELAETEHKASALVQVIKAL